MSALSAASRILCVRLDESKLNLPDGQIVSTSIPTFYAHIASLKSHDTDKIERRTCQIPENSPRLCGRKAE